MHIHVLRTMGACAHVCACECGYVSVHVHCTYTCVRVHCTVYYCTVHAHSHCMRMCVRL